MFNGTLYLESPSYVPKAHRKTEDGNTIKGFSYYTQQIKDGNVESTYHPLELLVGCVQTTVLKLEYSSLIFSVQKRTRKLLNWCFLGLPDPYEFIM